MKVTEKNRKEARNFDFIIARGGFKGSYFKSGYTYCLFHSEIYSGVKIK